MSLMYRKSVNNMNHNIQYPMSKVDLGIIGERAAKAALDKLEVLYEKNSINGYGADFALEDTLLEVKNLSGKYCLNPTIIQSEVISRFEQSDPDHQKNWIFVTSKLTASQRSRSILAEHGVKVIEWGNQIKSNSFRSIAKASNCISSKLRMLIQIPKRVFSLSKSCIDDYGINISYIGGKTIDHDGIVEFSIPLGADLDPPSNGIYICNVSKPSGSTRNHLLRQLEKLVVRSVSIFRHIVKSIGDTMGVSSSNNRRVF